MNIVFLGTPEFSVNALNEIHQSSHKIVAVITQPDRINGRNNKVEFGALKKAALALGLKVLQFEKIRNHIDELSLLGADIFVTAAYGQILTQNILDLPKHGVINIHASLLPKYRGSAPVQWALINGEEKVGVTIMQTALSVDSGDIIAKAEVKLSGDENCHEVLKTLSEVGSKLIVKVLNDIQNGTANFEKQNIDDVTHCRMLKKEDEILSFNTNCNDFVNRVRALTPKPAPYIVTKFGKLKIHKAEKIVLNCDELIQKYKTNISNDELKVGQVVVSNPKIGLYVAALDGLISLINVQSENAKVMNICDFLRGKKIEEGMMLCE